MLTFEEKTYAPAAGETVLDCLTRHGVDVPSFCRNGACQTCLLKVTEGEAPARAQVGLKPSLAKLGLILTCVCPTDRDLALARTDSAPSYRSRIVGVEVLSPRVHLVHLERPAGMIFEGGQFVTVRRPQDGVERPYSIASLPDEPHLTLHVMLYPDGALSPWLVTSPGAELELRGPFGECSYDASEPEAPLLLAGTGTGLAPLVAIARSALLAGHRGGIRLYHGARDPADLYFSEQLGSLSRAHPGLKVCEVAREGTPSPPPPGIRRLVGDLLPLALSEHERPEALRSYLCGSPDFVQRMRKSLYLRGASLAKIHADAFFGRAGVKA